MNRTGFTPGKTRFEDYDELHGSKIPDKIFGQSTSRSNQKFINPNDSKPESLAAEEKFDAVKWRDVI